MHMKKIQKNEDDLPHNSEDKSYWLVVFLHFLGSQEEDYVTLMSSPSLVFSGFKVSNMGTRVALST